MKQLEVKNYKIYEDADGNKTVFKYRWVFGQWIPKVGKLRLGLAVLPVVQDGFNYDLHACDRKKFEAVTFPVEKLCTKFKGIITGEGFLTALFTVGDKKKLFQIISEVSSVMRTNGVVADPTIDRYAGFPSYEYASAEIDYVFKGELSFSDIEDYMLKESHLKIDSYDEATVDGFRAVSDQRFDPEVQTDGAYFLELIKDKYNDLADEVDAIAALCKASKIMNEHKTRSEIRTTDDFSAEYQRFQGLYM